MMSFRPVAEKMARNGANQDDIVRAFQNHVRCKVYNFYSTPKNDLVPIVKTISSALSRQPDSKAEGIFYNLLIDSRIQFDFQYRIGPYRADYLIYNYLVVELDGPQHKKRQDEARDKYLEKMGYKVMRVPIWLLAADGQAVIEAIKEQKPNKKQQIT